MKIKGLFVEYLFEKYGVFKNLVLEILAQSQKFMFVKLQLICAFFSSQNFLKHFCSVLFYGSHLNLVQSKPRV